MALPAPHRFVLPLAVVVASIAVLIAFPPACGGGGGGSEPPSAPPEPPGPPEPPPPEPPPPTPWEPLDPLAATRQVDVGSFATAPTCAVCHANAPDALAMRDADGAAIAPMDLWRGSVMANSARDPFWRAVMAAEVATNPTAAAEIEGECMRCHAPMAHETLRRTGDGIRATQLEGDSDLTQLALDGGSCTLCHQIMPAGLGEESSYTGGFVIGTERKIMAGHPDPNPSPMWRQTGFTPVYATHVATSAMCATCHTLETHALDEDGAHTGHVLLEQGAYLEWRNSVFNDEIETPGPEAASCVRCHMPSLDSQGRTIETAIARNPNGGDFGPGAAPIRSAFHQHVLVGGNTWLPRLLRDHADELQPNASTAALEANEAAARALLTRSTARLTIADAGREGDVLAFDVGVANLAGHKLPTGYPSRRAWLRVRVRDAAGSLVFASGEHDAEGRVLDARGAVQGFESPGGPFEPHHATIDDANRVQIYESVMKDAGGAPTWRLLRGADYAKDNRILPRGWDPAHEDATRAGARGAATQDADFTGGTDTVHYRVTAPAAAGPFTLEVDLLYQALAPRYAAELFAVDDRAVANFRRMWEAADRRPETVAKATKTLP